MNDARSGSADGAAGTREPSEHESSRVIANKILDRPWGDPDDDLAVLSRQLLRADERIANLLAAYKNMRDARDALLDKASGTREPTFPPHKPNARHP